MQGTDQWIRCAKKGEKQEFMLIFYSVCTKNKLKDTKKTN